MQVYLNKQFAFRSVEIFAYDPGPGYDTFYYPCPTDPSMMMAQKVDSGKIYDPGDPSGPRPLLTLPWHTFQDLLAALVTTASEMGIQPPTMDHITGELTATKDHLQSLRDNNARLMDIITLCVTPPSTSRLTTDDSRL